MSGVVEFSAAAGCWTYSCSWGCWEFDFDSEAEATEAFYNHKCVRSC